MRSGLPPRTAAAIGRASAARSRGSGWEEFAEKLFYAAEAKISARKDVAEGVFVKAFVPKMYIADFEIFAAEGSCGDEK